MIKVLFVLLVLCTAALVTVGIAVLLRVRRHLKQERMNSHSPSTVDEVDGKVEEKSK